MEGLANEKMALEQMLATEKQALNNEKQDLSDQLKTCLNQLRETESLLQQEQSVRIQLEGFRDQLEGEKAALQHNLQEQIDENATLKNDLLMLQANHEKDRLLIETLRKQLDEQEEVLTRQKESEEEEQLRRQQLEAEKDDLANQILVLTEERDMARGNEEDLFETLRERTHDLERLQESYVDMTDRCNDFQDEVAELREKLDSYRQAMKDRDAILLHPSPGMRSSMNSMDASLFVAGSSPNTLSMSSENTLKVVHSDKRFIAEQNAKVAYTKDDSDKPNHHMEHSLQSNNMTRGSTSGSADAAGTSQLRSSVTSAAATVTAAAVSTSEAKKPSPDTQPPLSEKKLSSAVGIAAQKPVKLPPPEKKSVPVNPQPMAESKPAPLAASSRTRSNLEEDADNYDDDFDDYEG